jgi:hypothetical protein
MSGQGASTVTNEVLATDILKEVIKNVISYVNENSPATLPSLAGARDLGKLDRLYKEHSDISDLFYVLSEQLAKLFSVNAHGEREDEVYKEVYARYWMHYRLSRVAFEAANFIRASEGWVEHGTDLYTVQSYFLR